MKRPSILTIAALAAAVAIGAGAFGAHGASARAAELLRTGAFYQLVHAIAAVALAPKRQAWLLLGGSTLFALSLYALALGAPRFIGAITPFGGVAMIGGWLWIALSRSR